MKMLETEKHFHLEFWQDNGEGDGSSTRFSLACTHLAPVYGDLA